MSLCFSETDCPRVAEMMRALLDRAVEIEQHSSGKVNFSYSLFQVEIEVKGPPERRKIKRFPPEKEISR